MNAIIQLIGCEDFFRDVGGPRGPRMDEIYRVFRSSIDKAVNDENYRITSMMVQVPTSVIANTAYMFEKDLQQDFFIDVILIGSPALQISDLTLKAIAAEVGVAFTQLIGHLADLSASVSTRVSMHGKVASESR